MRNNADQLAFLLNVCKGGQGSIQTFFVKRAEPFVKEEGIHLHVFACHLRKAEGKAQADHKAFAAR